MRFLIEPRGGVWVAVNEGLAGDKSDPVLINDLRESVASVDQWFFDLDDNHAPSPAKKIAFKAIGTRHYSPRWWKWCLGTAYALAREGKAAESERWFKYVETFLRSPKAVEDVKRRFNAEGVGETFYPGVRELCELLPGRKDYVTRNIDEVGAAYASALGIDGCYSEENNKGERVRRVIAERGLRVVGVDGDSAEDGEMIDAAKGCGVGSVSFYSMKRPSDAKCDRRFDYFVGKNRRGLVELLS